MKEIFSLLLVFAVGIGTAHAEETLRCGSKIVSVGMTAAEVKKYCGKPSSTEVEEHVVRAAGRIVGTTQLNIWTYKRGNSQAAAVLEFDQDQLLSITYVSK